MGRKREQRDSSMDKELEEKERRGGGGRIGTWTERGGRRGNEGGREEKREEREEEDGGRGERGGIGKCQAGAGWSIDIDLRCSPLLSLRGALSSHWAPHLTPASSSGPSFSSKLLQGNSQLLCTHTMPCSLGVTSSTSRVFGETPLVCGGQPCPLTSA